METSIASTANGSTALLPIPVSAGGTVSKTRQRQVLLLVAAAAASAIVTFALMSSRAGSSPALAAAPTDAPPTHAPAKPAPVTALQKWNGDNRSFWLGNQRGAAFELLSENSVQTWFGTVQPALVVRCTAKTTETFVYTRSPVKIEPHADGRTVTVSIDDEPMRTERWSSSDDHVALFAPDGAALAQRLLHAHTLRFGYSPHNSSDVVAQFAVAGLADSIEPVAKHCGWKD